MNGTITPMRICGFCAFGNRHDLCSGTRCQCDHEGQDMATWQETQARRKAENRSAGLPIPGGGGKARREAAGRGVGTSAPPVALVAPEIPRKAGAACLCGCGETTGGGKFRPGHDSRFLSRMAGEVERGRTTADAVVANMVDAGLSEALQAKFRKRVAPR